jgi:hypothetical protein
VHVWNKVFSLGILESSIPFGKDSCYTVKNRGNSGFHYFGKSTGHVHFTGNKTSRNTHLRCSLPSYNPNSKI